MGKLIKFEKKAKEIETQSEELTQAEIEACEIAKTIRKAFTDKEIEQLKRELGEYDD